MLKNCSKADLKVVATELGLAFDKKATIVQLIDLIQKSNYYKKDIEFVEGLVNSTIEERKHLEEIALEKAKAEQGQMNLEQIKLERVKAELELARLRSESNSENKNENSGENDKKECIESLDSLIKSIRTLTVKLSNRPEGFSYFFSSLERAFISKNVPEKFKAEILLNLLGEKASNVITYIKDDELGDYSKVKAIVLREFEPTPQVSLENFRKTQRAEYFYELLKPGQISLHDTNLRLQNSVFGYIVSGSLLAKGEAEIHCGLITDNSELEKTLKEFWEIENIERESEISVTKEVEICEEHFLKNYSRTETGKFMVKMPFKEDPSCLGESRKKAEKCLNSLWNRLRRELKLCELYKIFMQEYLHMGHIEEVIEYEEPYVNYYIPHHCVFRPESNTTPLRVVYNASALTSSGKSLNCIQFNGGTIQDDLLSIMLRFRKHKFAFVADIKKMYRMILIDPNQRDLLRILFKEEVNDPIKVYKLCTVTYGTTSAPFLATRTVQQLSKDEGKDFPLASSVLLQDVYMDDVLTGEDNQIKAKDMQQQLISLFDRGGMELHKWSANNQSLLCDEMKESDYSFSKETKTLGILWKPQPDCFGFNLIIEQSEAYTKRAVLSQIARIFDPLDLLGPIITKAEIFLQKLWLLKLDWGDTLPLKENTECQSFLNSLKFVNLINVPRWILSEQSIRVELHGFADASELAYGAVIYVKSINSYGGSEVKLLISKSRVAPLKFVTIPRLELCAAVLLSKLMR
ncbi:hypothetical protein AVEN_78893-1, partial [Araneus ventricosus]